MINRSAIHLVEMSKGQAKVKKVRVETAECGGESRATAWIYNSPLFNRGEGNLGLRIVATKYIDKEGEVIRPKMAIDEKTIEELLEEGFYFRSRYLKADYGDSIPLPIFSYAPDVNEIQVASTKQTFAVFDNKLKLWVPQADPFIPEEIVIIMLSDFLDKVSARKEIGHNAASSMNLSGFSAVDVESVMSHNIEGLKYLSEDECICTSDNKELLSMGEYGWVPNSDHTIDKTTRLKVCMALHQTPDCIFYSGEDLISFLQQNELSNHNHLTL